MLRDEINLHIPPEKQMTALFDLVVHNLAATIATRDFIFSKLLNMSEPTFTKEKIFDMLTEFNTIQKEQIEQIRTELYANLMTKYAE